MKTRFDYKAALVEVAVPAFNTLPDSVLSIYRELRDSCEFEDLAQKLDLDVPMPESLRARFEGLGSETLSFAARTIYFFGHWGGGDRRGATWKFANLADQVLTRRLELAARSSARFFGYRFEVHEGALRLCVTTPATETGIELGPATEMFLAAARAWRYKLPGCPASRYSTKATEWQDFERAAHQATRVVPDSLAVLLTPAWARFLSVGQDFMREEGKCSDDCPECGKQQLFKSAASNHELTCSRYPMEARADAVLRHGTAFGLTVEQVAAARAAILSTPGRTREFQP